VIPEDRWYSLDRWRLDIYFNRTRLGYRDWVSLMAEAREDEPDFPAEHPIFTVWRWRQATLYGRSQLGYLDWCKEMESYGYRPFAQLGTVLRGAAA